MNALKAFLLNLDSLQVSTMLVALVRDGVDRIVDFGAVRGKITVQLALCLN